MNQVLATRYDALAAFDQANQAKIKQLAIAAVAAKKASEPTKAKQLTTEARALRAKRKVIEDTQRNNVLSTFTPAQRKIVKGYNLYSGTVIKFYRAELTVKQKADIKKLAMTKGETVTPETNAKEFETIKSAIALVVTTDILTTEQKAKLAAPRKKKKPAEKK